MTSLETATDIDGNSYQTVKIGNQLWMAENLRVTHYRNGDLIPNVTSDRQWSGLGIIINASRGAYCYYNNDANNLSTYGCLYNWFAIKDSRSICLTGWHIPTDVEWKILETYLGGSSVAGGKMKEAGTTHWDFPNTRATNESGFCALPGGYRNGGGSYNGMGSNAQFWSSTEGSGNYYALYRLLGCYYSQVLRSDDSKESGLSVRCVMD